MMPMLLSHDYDPNRWSDINAPESPFESWAAVRQDMWGLHCFEPGQSQHMADAAQRISIQPKHIVGVIGAQLGGLTELSSSTGTYFDLFERNDALLRRHGSEFTGKYIRPSPWRPDSSPLAENRFHAIIAYGALSSVERVDDLAASLGAALKPGGNLYVHDAWSVGPAVEPGVCEGGDEHAGPVFRHALEPSLAALQTAGLQPILTRDLGDDTREILRRGLQRAEQFSPELRRMPDPHRKQRMMAFATELGRISLLHKAIDDGRLTIVAAVFRKPRF